MRYPKRNQYKHTKKPYRIRNWSEYEEGLRNRGNLTIWISQAAIDGWRAKSRKKRGGQRIYSDLAIETGLTVRLVYHLGLRQTEGFLASLFGLLCLDMSIPDHTTLSRRAKKLGRLPFAPLAAEKPIHILIDSTGLRVHVGNQRNPPKHRDWRKLHLAADRDSGEVVAVDLTAKRATDPSSLSVDNTAGPKKTRRIPALLKQIDAPFASVSADGAYDTEPVYNAIHSHNSGDRKSRILIPPRRNAELSPKDKPAMKDRNRHIRAIDRYGRQHWYKHSGINHPKGDHKNHGRSVVENTVYRYKVIIGREMRARSLAGQRLEARIGCKILNTMTRLGMPDSYRVN